MFGSVLLISVKQMLCCKEPVDGDKANILEPSMW